MLCASRFALWLRASGHTLQTKDGCVSRARGPISRSSSSRAARRWQSGGCESSQRISRSVSGALSSERGASPHSRSPRSACISLFDHVRIRPVNKNKNKKQKVLVACSACWVLWSRCSRTGTWTWTSSWPWGGRCRRPQPAASSTSRPSGRSCSATCPRDMKSSTERRPSDDRPPWTSSSRQSQRDLTG